MRNMERVLGLVFFLLVGLAVLVMSFSAVEASSSSSDVTVGDFAVLLADSLNGSRERISTLPEARSFFAGRGIVMPSGVDAGSILTEGHVESLVSAVGLAVASRQPERVFGAEAVDGLLRHVRRERDQGRLSLSLSSDTELAELSPEEGIEEVPASGACCFGDGSCTFEKTPGHCVNAGGFFKGKGIECSSNPCASGKGVCCTDGECSFTFPGDCPGVFRGLNFCTFGTCQGAKARETESPFDME